MRSARQRFWGTLTATLLAAACGALVAYLSARAIHLERAHENLKSSVDIVMMEVTNLDREAYVVLDAMNQSSSTACSDADIASMRKLLLQEELVMDAGRIHDGQIECAAQLNKSDIPPMQFTPRYTARDGAKYYRSMPEYKSGKDFMVVIQKGDAYAVLGGWNDSFLSRYWGASSMHFSVMVTYGANGESGVIVGPVPSTIDGVPHVDGQGQIGNYLYAARCSSRYWKCVIAYNSMDEVLSGYGTNLTVASGCGGMIGGALGLVVTLLYRRTRGMEQQLRRSIRRDKLVVLYQPIVEMASGRIVGAEALSRWTDEDGLSVSPEFFVKLAEQRGFVSEITKLVVRRSLNELGPILTRVKDFRLSLNVTATDLSDPVLLPMLEDERARTGVDARSLAIEVTESSTARHRLAAQTIRELRRLGYSIHIDDFGTGYSSLAYLQDLAVDAVKIDRAFTHAIGTGSVTELILRPMLEMVEALNLQVIVEGVEKHEQADYFVSKGKDVLAQGWYFGRPCSADELLRLLAGQAREAAEKPEAVGAPSRVV
jgi:sensor c-di-GMP phosphodiesterase-like protein